MLRLPGLYLPRLQDALPRIVVTVTATASEARGPVDTVTYRACEARYRRRCISILSDASQQVTMISSVGEFFSPDEAPFMAPRDVHHASSDSADTSTMAGHTIYTDRHAF